MSLSTPRAQQILEAAMDLAETNGVGGVTTAALARRLEFTEAALYRYYSGKSGILVAVLEHLGNRLLATMLLEVDAAAATELGHVARHLTHHINRFAYRRGLLIELLLFAAANRSEELREAGNAFMQEYRERMTIHFAQLHERAILATTFDAEELGRIWICQLLGGFLHCRLSSEAWQPAEQSGFRAFCQMLGARQEAS